MNSKSYFKSEAFDDFQEHEFKQLMLQSRKLTQESNGKNGNKLHTFLSELVDFMEPDEHSENTEVLEIGLTIFNQFVTSNESLDGEDEHVDEATSKINIIKK